MLSDQLFTFLQQFFIIVLGSLPPGSSAVCPEVTQGFGDDAIATVLHGPILSGCQRSTKGKKSTGQKGACSQHQQEERLPEAKPVSSK